MTSDHRAKNGLRRVGAASHVFRVIVGLVWICVYPVGAAAALWMSAHNIVPVSVIFATVIVYISATLSTAVGHHSYFAHRAFRAHRVVEIFLIVFGCAALGSFLVYAAEHRRHHRFADRIQDTHSPYRYGTATRWARMRGLYHSHIGWILDPDEAVIETYVPDLICRPFYRRMDRVAGLWALVPLGIVGGVGLLATGTWMGAWIGILWGIFGMCLSIHVHLSVNSLTHVFGSRPYKTNDASTNLPLLGVFSFGPGWHNNHHAFPASMRAGFDAGQIDVGARFVELLGRVGLTWSIKPPPNKQARAARINQAPTLPVQKNLNAP